MRSAKVVALVLVLVGTSASASAQRSRVVVSDLEEPSGIAFLSDGRMVVNERGGTIKVVGPGGDAEPLATIETVVSGETGLLGIAVAPDEASVYVFATAPGGGSNDVWKVELATGDREPIVEGLPAGSIHNGGGVAFDRDGMLLVSHGEQGDEDLSQDPAVPGGKVYRFTPEGDPAPASPFDDSAALAIGLRNPFGLAVDPLTGAAWVTENGPESFDEVNRIDAGGNYGWPVVSGPAGEDAPDIGVGDYHDPAASYEEIIVPTGISFATYDAEGVSRGDLFFAAYGDGTIRHLRLDDDRRGVVSEESIDVGEAVIALAWGPEGLYYTSETSIELIPYRRVTADEGSPDSAVAPPSPSPTGSPASDGGREGITSLVGVLILVGLVAAFLWSRSRFERAGRQPPGV